jgi:hypothetical protein
VIVVAGLDKLVAAYVEDILGFDVVGVTPYVGFAVYNAQNTVVAGILITNYRGHDCEITMAADTPKWAQRNVLRVVFEYIFYRMKCVRCTCSVAKRKGTGRTRRFLVGMGFALEGSLRRAYDGEYDALVYGLLAENCRFLAGGPGGMSGQKDTASADAT